MYNGKYFVLSDFKGGYAGNLPSTGLALNQAYDLDNIVIKTGGKGWRTRLGNSTFGKAVKIIQDLTYSAVATNATGELVTIAYTTGATAGSEVVTVVGNAISIQIQSGVSTATQVKAKFDASAAAIALATCTISGTGGTAQTAPVTATALVIAAMASGAAVQGIGDYTQADGDNWIMAVCGAKIYKSESYDGIMDDISAALTVTTGDNHWDIFTFNDVCYGFGGPAASPNAAWKYNGTGTAAILTGNPSVALAGAFPANNRILGWMGATVYWTIIGNGEDWTGAGSGSSVAGSLADNSSITCCKVISTNYVLVFKKEATYQMVISSAPFPVYSLFDNIGCVGKGAAVNVDGTVYFIASNGRMYSTNGETLQDYPKQADNLWASIPTTYYQHIMGVRQKGADFDWLVWMVPAATTNSFAIIWDLENKCWLRCTTGFKMNVVGENAFHSIYLGGYDGKIYTPNTTATYADSSEATPGTITGYWKSGWISPDNIDKITQVRKLGITYTPKVSGNITLAYGYDGIADSSSTTLAQTVNTATEVYSQKSAVLSGRGNTFEFKISQSSAVIDTEIQSILISGKSFGQKNQAED